jgi:hypothetical protein
LGLGRESITDDKEVPKDEMARRTTVRSDKVYVKLLINNQEVARTHSVPLIWPGFEASVMEKF